MKIPQNVLDLFNDQEATKILTTVSKEGIPHSIVAGSIAAPSDDTLCVGEIMMQTTAKNMEDNPKASIIVVKGMESYQVVVEIKGKETKGPLFEHMNAELGKINLACKSVWLFKALETFDQSAGPNAGKKIG